MIRPIPVFSFVFAAYAMTSREIPLTARRLAAAPLNPRTPFRTAWRTQFARGASLFAKIALLKGSGPPQTRLGVGAAGEEDEEIWVGGIVEAGLGFVGAPVEDSRRPGGIVAGQPIRFHVINVLDWRIAACPDAPFPCPDRDASDMSAMP